MPEAIQNHRFEKTALLTITVTNNMQEQSLIVMHHNRPMGELGLACREGGGGTFDIVYFLIYGPKPPGARKSYPNWIKNGREDNVFNRMPNRMLNDQKRVLRVPRRTASPVQEPTARSETTDPSKATFPTPPSKREEDFQETPMTLGPNKSGVEDFLRTPHDT